MQFLLTFLAAITSLSTYTLVGVHADTATQCAGCPSQVEGQAFDRKCYNGGIDGKTPNTVCYYKYGYQSASSAYCRYDEEGNNVQGSGLYSCPFMVAVDSSDCPVCTA
ncbi:hypothetical protein BDN67DRAFT_971490 [Paxillus ammoniavirescens]|nr:hypothetical protein BDN67DRAFT_971490 [Paxillus ammoniavirescens]